MTFVRRLLPLLLASFVGVSGVLAVSRVASAAPRRDPDAAAEDVRRARRDGEDFCVDPPKPLSWQARALCPLAAEAEGCGPLAKACGDQLEVTKKDLDRPTTPRAPLLPSGLLQALGTIGQVLLWILVALIVIAILVPVLRAIARARRDRAAKEPEVAKPAEVTVADDPVPIPPGEAEVLLSTAQEYERRGDLRRALFVYLAAALRALDARGAIRIAKHRTNGEYVRTCSEEPARAPLREIVREVDSVHFGGLAPNAEGVARVGARAAALVKAAQLVILALALAIAGCSDAPAKSSKVGGGRSDPAGAEIFLSLLERQAFTVKSSGALAGLPLPKPDDEPFAILLDPAQTALDDETRDHLLRWVRAGGTLVLLGSPERWPEEVGARRRVSMSRTVELASGAPTPVDGDDDDDDEPPAGQAIRVGKLATPGAITVTEGTVLATTGGETFAAKVDHGKGEIFAIASRDPFTNVGLATPGNPAFTVDLFDAIGRKELRVPRREDGTSPAGDPVTSLLRAGLGLGLAHGAGFVLLLFLAAGVRLSRPVPTAPPRRRAFVEHVEATAAFWARGRLAPHALAAYARWADERLRSLSPRGTDAVAFVARLTKRPPEEIAQIWNRALQARTDEARRGDELRTIKALSAFVAAAERAHAAPDPRGER
jgi:hypothetical protein